jgi:flagellar protein FliS
MVGTQAYNRYRNSQVYDGMDPKELILLLYNEALKRLTLAKKGLMQGNSRVRGEHLGRAIAIIAELHTCLDSNADAEEIRFLRGLYQAILLELPKVNLTNDVQTLDTAFAYIAKLRDIWQDHVMGKPAMHV